MDTQSKLAKVIGTLSVHVTLSRTAIGFCFFLTAAMIGSFWNLTTRIDDVGEKLTSEITSLKVDVATLVTDVRALKTDFRAMKTDLATMARQQDQIIATLTREYGTLKKEDRTQ